MSELGFGSGKPITLYGDNQASISIAKNPVGHTRAKQIDIRFHYLRELVERGAISIEYIATTAMLADGLTKPLAPVRGLETCFATIRASHYGNIVSSPPQTAGQARVNFAGGRRRTGCNQSNSRSLCQLDVTPQSGSGAVTPRAAI